MSCHDYADWLHQLQTVSVGWIEQHSVWWCLNKTHQWLSITTAKEKGAVLPRPLWLVWSLLQELYHRGIAICCWMSFGISTRSGPRWPDVVRKKASWIIWGMLSTFITRWSCLVMDHVTCTWNVTNCTSSQILVWWQQWSRVHLVQFFDVAILESCYVLANSLQEPSI